MEDVLAESRLGGLVNEWTDLNSTVVLYLTGGLVLVLLVLGILSWMRGRKIGSVLIFLVLLVGAGWFLAPPSWFEGRLDVDEASVSLWLGIAVLVALMLGVFAMARLAKPSSWWAQRRYASEKYDRSVERYGWSRIKAR